MTHPLLLLLGLSERDGWKVVDEPSNCGLCGNPLPQGSIRLYEASNTHIGICFSQDGFLLHRLGPPGGRSILKHRAASKAFRSLMDKIGIEEGEIIKRWPCMDGGYEHVMTHWRRIDD